MANYPLDKKRGEKREKERKRDSREGINKVESERERLRARANISGTY